MIFSLTRLVYLSQTSDFFLAPPGDYVPKVARVALFTSEGLWLGQDPGTVDWLLGAGRQVGFEDLRGLDWLVGWFRKLPKAIGNASNYQG